MQWLNFVAQTFLIIELYNRSMVFNTTFNNISVLSLHWLAYKQVVRWPQGKSEYDG